MSTKKIARVHKNWSQPEPTWSSSMRISAECIWWIDFFALRAGYPFLVANLKGYSVIHHSYLHEMFRLIKKHLCFLSGSTWGVKFGWAPGCKIWPCELEEKSSWIPYHFYAWRFSPHWVGCYHSRISHGTPLFLTNLHVFSWPQCQVETWVM